MIIAPEPQAKSDANHLVMRDGRQEPPPPEPRIKSRQMKVIQGMPRPVDETLRIAQKKKKDGTNRQAARAGRPVTQTTSDLLPVGLPTFTSGINTP
jgi:hypothetical protein